MYPEDLRHLNPWLHKNRSFALKWHFYLVTLKNDKYKLIAHFHIRIADLSNTWNEYSKHNFNIHLSRNVDGVQKHTFTPLTLSVWCIISLWWIGPTPRMQTGDLSEESWRDSKHITHYIFCNPFVPLTLVSTVETPSSEDAKRDAE